MCNCSWKEGWEYVKKLHRHQGHGRLQAQEPRSPCSLWWGRMSPCSPQRSMVEQRSTWSPWRTQNPAQRSLWPLGKPKMEQACGGTSGTMERETQAGDFWEGHIRDTRCTSLFLKDCTMWKGDPQVKKKMSVRRPPPKEEGMAETCGELTVLLWGSRERNITEYSEWEGIQNVEPRNKGGVGERCLKSWVYFSLPYPDLTGNKLKLISPSWVYFALDGNGWVISSCPYLRTQAPSSSRREWLNDFGGYLVPSQGQPK